MTNSTPDPATSARARFRPSERTRRVLIMTALIGGYFALPIAYAIWGFSQF